jgi:uncharacterized membrane protein
VLLGTIALLIELQHDPQVVVQVFYSHRHMRRLGYVTWGLLGAYLGHGAVDPSWFYDEKTRSIAQLQTRVYVGAAGLLRHRVLLYFSSLRMILYNDVVSMVLPCAVAICSLAEYGTVRATEWWCSHTTSSISLEQSMHARFVGCIVQGLLCWPCPLAVQ